MQKSSSAKKSLSANTLCKKKKTVLFSISKLDGFKVLQGKKLQYLILELVVVFFFFLKREKKAQYFRGTSVKSLCQQKMHICKETQISTRFLFTL